MYNVAANYISSLRIPWPVPIKANVYYDEKGAIAMC